MSGGAMTFVCLAFDLFPKLGMCA